MESKSHSLQFLLPQAQLGTEEGRCSRGYVGEFVANEASGLCPEHWGQQSMKGGYSPVLDAEEATPGCAQVR